MGAKQPTRLARVLDLIETQYGEQRAPRGVRSAFEWILWEKVGYLASDEHRAAAFRELSRAIGTTPRAILAAPKASLTAIACGIHPSRSADELKLCADIAERDHSGGLDRLLDEMLANKPGERPARAIAALKKYPGIGEPGAEKILLFTERVAVPALESNGVRAMLRLGFAREGKSYAATYKNLRAAILPECTMQCAWLARMHRLLRCHGQTLCKNSRPSCDACPLEDGCKFAAS